MKKIIRNYLVRTGIALTLSAPLASCQKTIEPRGDMPPPENVGSGGGPTQSAGAVVDSGEVPETAPDGGAVMEIFADASDAAPDAGSESTGGDRDAAGAIDAVAHVPDAGNSSDSGSRIYSECPDLPALIGGGTVGVVNIVEEQDHGLPGCYRCGLDVADFDGDGRTDVVMAGAFDSAFTPGMDNYTYKNAVRIYRNISCPGREIRFALQQEVPGVSGGGGALVKVGDYDGDGRRDFAVQFREGDSPSSDTSAFMNGGNWIFTRRPLVAGFDTNSTSMGMAAADIDQDGRDDLIFNSDGYGSGAGLWYKWNPQNAAWDPQQTTFPHAISYGGTLAAGDLDGDGFPDIAVGGNSSSPFGAYDCSWSLLYGEIHMNKGASANPRGIRPEASSSVGRFALRSDRSDPPVCSGMDNAGMLIADVDGDGHNDVIIAGSADAFQGPPGLNGTHYDFAVLRNVDGTGNNYVTFENVGIQYPNGTTNGGSGSLDFPNIAVGDLTGDGLPEIFIQGHHRDYGGDFRIYVYDSRLFLNVGGTDFVEQDLGLYEVGNGGQAMVDLNLDGKVDLLYTGASIAFHSNGANTTDYNNLSNLFARVYRNARP